MFCHQSTVEHYQHLLSRHYMIQGLNGERYRVNDIVSFLKSFHSDLYESWAACNRTIGYSHGLNELTGDLADAYRSFLKKRHDGQECSPARSYFLSNDKVYYYAYYWAISFVDGNRAKGLFRALEWFVSGQFPRVKKKSNPTSRRAAVYGKQRKINVLPERKKAESHAIEYGEHIVRASRRVWSLPHLWDGKSSEPQRCWKSQRRKRKQWLR